MTVLATIFASAPPTELLHWTVELRRPAVPSEYLAAGFVDVVATLETAETVTFRKSGMALALPTENGSGNQRLTIAVDNVSGAWEAWFREAIFAGEQALATLRVFRAADLSAPAELPLELPIVGGSFLDVQLQIECAVNDILSFAWPRLLYTAAFAPGVKYAGR